MKLIEFWILESVVYECKWDHSKVMIFKSYESVIDFIEISFGKESCIPKFVQMDGDGYFRTMVYETKDNNPWSERLRYVIHKGSIVKEP